MTLATILSGAHTLSIHSPAIPAVGGVAALEPVRLSGAEGINGLLEYELLLKTPDALNLGASGAMDFELDAFIGRELSCVIQLDGSGEFQPGAVGASTDRVGAGARCINALITDACLWGEEGRHVQYRLTLRPWLHLATLSTDCKIYQNQTVVEILDELLSDYPFPVDKRLIERYPARDYQTQFNESDFDFFSRLCQEWGINYFFEHAEGKHRLVLVDHMGAWKKNDSRAYQQVEYHVPGWKTDAEYLHSFVPANQLGGVHLPRIGQEVLVDFIGGDADLPICTGRVHNQLNLPPWELPGQSALSGFRSRELTKEGGNSAAGRSNHLVLDDTEGKIQAQLKSDHQSSSISLGHITRIEDNAGRKDARGEGFELRTDGHGAIRAKDGLLITTEGRPNAASHVKDMEETVQRLTSARDQIEGLADAASVAKAQDKTEDQALVAKAIKAQTNAIQGRGGKPAEGAFPELAEPHLVLASPEGIEVTAATCVHVHTGQHVQLTSAGHTSLSAGHRFLASVAEGMRLFALKSGIKVFASEGDVQIDARSDAMDVSALKDIDIVSTEDTVYIIAKKKVVVNGGTSFSEWSEGGIQHGTLGTWVEHASQHATPGPDNKPVPASSTNPEPNPLKTALVIALRSHAVDGWPIANEPYTLYRDGAQIEMGIPDVTLSDLHDAEGDPIA